MIYDIFRMYICKVQIHIGKSYYCRATNVNFHLYISKNIFKILMVNQLWSRLKVPDIYCQKLDFELLYTVYIIEILCFKIPSATGFRRNP